MTWDWTTFWIMILIIAGVVLLFFIISIVIYALKKRAEGPSHIELYFDENFRGIIGEWDFVYRDRAKEFKKDIQKRLINVGTNVNSLEKNRNSLDKRMDSLEKEIKILEGF